MFQTPIKDVEPYALRAGLPGKVSTYFEIASLDPALKGGAFGKRSGKTTWIFETVPRKG